MINKLFFHKLRIMSIKECTENFFTINIIIVINFNNIKSRKKAI